MSYKDPANQKLWYQNNKVRTRALQDAKREEIRRIIAEAKNVPCLDCRKRYPSYVMDFDHVTGDKCFNIGMAASRNTPLAALLEEIAKCDVVCANCHRERSYGR